MSTSAQLHAEAGSRALSVARSVLFALWLIIVLSTPIEFVGELPTSLASPPGAMALLPASFWDYFLNPRVLKLFRFLLVILITLVLVGIHPRRLITLAAAVGLLLFDGLLKTYTGWINHRQLPALYVTILLALSTPKTRSLDSEGMFSSPRCPCRVKSREPPPASVLRLAAMLIALTYTLTGAERIISGGARMFLGDALPIHVLLRTIEISNYVASFGVTATQHATGIVLLKLGFIVITVAEIVSVFAVFNNSIRRLWLPSIVVFHIGTLLLMNIFFWENLILLGIFFTDLPTRIEAATGPKNVMPPPSGGPELRIPVKSGTMTEKRDSSMTHRINGTASLCAP